MDRRKFLERAGLGSVAFSFPLFAGKAWAGHGHGHKHGRKNFHFVVLSAVPGTIERLIISGDGRFGSHHVHGGGSFDHFQAPTGVAPPLPVVATGTWRAKKFVRFTPPVVTAPGDPEGTHGVYAAGLLELTADFYPEGQSPVRDVPVLINCNLGPAGASTPGKEEGVYVTFPELDFEPAGLGVTIFSTNREPHDDD
jgi:hypothetical protein